MTCATRKNDQGVLKWKEWPGNAWDRRKWTETFDIKQNALGFLKLQKMTKDI